MSPIIDLQRRLQEVGRVRMGERNAKGYPSRLEHWKLTSRDQVRLQAAAQAFGGKVEPWEGHDGQFALHTETDSLPILLLPGQTLSSFYELWSGGGAQRRCDGQTELLSDGPCLCDPEARECKPHTRLQVLLPDVPGLGCWRLDTTGYYAAVELAGTVELLEYASTRGAFLPARLRIDQRSVLRDGQTRRFPVPTLDIDIRPLEMHAITQAAAQGEVAELPQGYTPVPALSAGTSVAEGLAAADAQVEQKTRTARSAAPIGGTEDFGDDLPIPVPDDEAPLGEEGESTATADQQKLLMATAREHGWADAARYDLTENICGEGIRSVKKVPKAKVDELLNALSNPAKTVSGGTPTNDQLVGRLQAYGDALSIRQQVDAAISQHVDERDWLERQVERLKVRYEEAQGAA